MTDGDTELRVASLEAVRDTTVELTKVTEWVVVFVKDVQEAEVTDVVLRSELGLAD